MRYFSPSHLHVSCTTSNIPLFLHSALARRSAAVRVQIAFVMQHEPQRCVCKSRRQCGPPFCFPPQSAAPPSWHPTLLPIPRTNHTCSQAALPRISGELRRVEWFCSFHSMRQCSKQPVKQPKQVDLLRSAGRKTTCNWTAQALPAGNWPP